MIGLEQLPERIRTKIVLAPCPVPNLKGDCWIWTRSTHKFGYGYFRVDGKTHYVHRLVYQLAGRIIPTGKELDHLCRVPACCNPDHVEPVTHAINVSRGNWFIVKNAAKTHCPKGHSLTDALIHLHAGRKPSRDCRECARIRGNDYYRRKCATRNRSQVSS
jgi:hypothetical protein